MEYMLLIFQSEAEGQKSTQAESAKTIAAYGAYTEALQKAGIMRSGARLRSVETATTVHLQAGETKVLNGPYAETREQLGGYYVIDVPDLDTAQSWAVRCPATSHGIVEVRPIWPIGDY